MTHTGPNNTAQRICAVLLLVGIAATYGQVVTFRYSGSADFLEVASNDFVMDGLGGQGLQWVWDGTPGHRWQPLTWFVRMGVASTDTQATLQHAISLFLHGINVLLVFMILERLCPRPITNLVIAGLFALHPVRAEAVAWVTALGEILGATCLLVALLAILEHVRTSKSIALAVAVLFSLGAIASSTNYAFAPLLVPLFVVVVTRASDNGKPEERLTPHASIWLPFATVTAYGVAKSPVATLLLEGRWAEFGAQALATLGGIATLLRQTVWPFELTIFYANRPVWPYVVAGALIVVLAVAVAVAFRRRAPLASFGLVVFLAALPPLITQTAPDSMQIPLAETYLALSGLVVALGGIAVPLRAGSYAQRALQAAGLALVVGLAFIASEQAAHRANSFTILRHNIAVCDVCDEPYRLLGDLYAARPLNIGPAIELYQQAIALNPSEPDHRMALAYLYWNQGNIRGARRELWAILAQHPDHEQAQRILQAIE